MNRLFKRRLSRHWVRMAKYLKYVFNDFFVIALIFLAGGLGLEYSNFLKGLKSGQWWIGLVMVVIILLTVQVGRLATLIQEPDRVFLLPRDQSMRHYLSQASWYSFINAGLVQLVVWFLLLPLFRIQFSATNERLGGWLLLMMMMKAGWLLCAYRGAFQDLHWCERKCLNQWVIPVALITLGSVQVWFAVVVALAWLVEQNWFLRHPGPLNWRNLIQSESNRMRTIYRIFNMFVDVPNLGDVIRRRRYLDPILRLVKTDHVYSYLYVHGLARDQESSGLFCRLTIIGMLILLWLPDSWLALLMGIVFIYLIAFQLIPFYFHFDDNVMVHIYPAGVNNQLADFERVLAGLLLLSCVGFAITFALAGHGWLVDFINVAVLLVEIIGLIKFYVPRKIRQVNYQKRG